MTESENLNSYLKNLSQEFDNIISKKNFEYYNFSRTFEDKPDYIESPEDVNTLNYQKSLKIEEIFYHKNQRLLLLGEPGAGKTILLLSFLKKIATKLKNEGSKSLLPLFAPIRRWDRKEDIICWLINQAKVIDSGIDESLLKQKIRNREVLFLLDGLDELPAKDCSIKDPNAKQRDYRLEFMQKFADFESKYGQNPTIITCRNRDYQNIINKNGSQKLNLNGAVILKQLNYKEIKNYLEYSFAADSQFFRDIWTTLIQNSVLRTMVRTPY